MARATYEASRCVDQACREEPRATKSREPERRVGQSHRPGGPRENPKERSLGETWGRRMRNRRSKGRKKSSAPPVDERRLGPGKATPCHDGGVEAVLAAHAESVKTTSRYRERSAHRYRAGVATEVSEARSRRRVEEDNAPTKLARSAEAMRSVVKRSHPRSRWAATCRVTPDEESVTMSREETGYGCS